MHVSSSVIVFVNFIYLVFSYHLSQLLLLPHEKELLRNEKFIYHDLKNGESVEHPNEQLLISHPDYSSRHFFHRNGRKSKQKWRHEQDPPNSYSSGILDIAMVENSNIFEVDATLHPNTKTPIHPHKIRHHHRHKHRQAQYEIEKFGEKRNPGMVIRLTKKTVDYILDNGRKFLEEDLTGRPMAEFSIMVLEQLNITAYAIKVAELKLPEIKYEKISRDTLSLSTCGGHLELRGLYRSVYRTTREGQFKAVVTGFESSLKIKLLKTIDGSLKLQDNKCSSSIVRAEVTLEPTLIKDVSDGIVEHLIDMLNNKICNYIDEYVHKMDEKLAQMLTVSSFQFETHENEIQFDAKLLGDIVLEDNYFDLDLAGEFFRGSIRTPFHSEDIVKHDSDTHRMVYLYVSEYLINSFFYQIDSYAFLRFNLHQIPEIKSLLRLNCDEAEDCLGKHFEWKGLFEPSTGRMEAKPITRPNIEIREEGALMKMNLTVDIGYQKVGAKARTVLMGFGLELELLIRGIEINGIEESNVYRLQPQATIKEMKISSVKPYVDQVGDFSQDFDNFVYARKTLFKEILNKNFHRIISLPVNLPFTAHHFTINFRHKTTVIEFDIKYDSSGILLLHSSKIP